MSSRYKLAVDPGQSHGHPLIGNTKMGVPIAVSTDGDISHFPANGSWNMLED